MQQGPPPNRGLLTEQGFKHIIACVEAMKAVTGDSVGLALDCGPGFNPNDALKLARAVEPYNLMWLEDMITGDYTPYVLADLYRDVTMKTTTPDPHRRADLPAPELPRADREESRQHHRPRSAAMSVGMAELKWIAEYADLHGILMAPHGTVDGLIGLAALVQVSATMPVNYIAFEYPIGRPEWWYDIVQRPYPTRLSRKVLSKGWSKPGSGSTPRRREEVSGGGGRGLIRGPDPKKRNSEKN